MVRDKIAKSLQKNYSLDQNAFMTYVITMLKVSREFEFRDVIPADAGNIDHSDNQKSVFVLNDEITLVSWRFEVIADGKPDLTSFACLLVRNHLCDDVINVFYFVKPEGMHVWDIYPVMAEVDDGGCGYKMLYGYSWADDLLAEEDLIDQVIQEGKTDNITPSYIGQHQCFLACLAYVVRNMPELLKSNQLALESLDWDWLRNATEEGDQLRDQDLRK